MQKQNLNDLIEYDDRGFFPKVLVNLPEYRMVLLSIRAGQAIPEYAPQRMVTIYAVRGHITVHEGSSPCELQAGEVVCIESGSSYRITAFEDSALLILSTGTSDDSEELDLREIPRPERHPLVFEKLDALAAEESFVLINDHDPVPLSRQIENLRPGQVTWKYIERGPDIFRIRIRRIAPRKASEVVVNAQSAGLVTPAHRV